MTDAVRCDRCGVPISLTGYRATNKDGRELLLCPEDYTTHADALHKQKWDVDRLTPPDPEFGLKVKTECSNCKGPAFTRPVKASPESVTVDVVHCKECDTRTCSFVVGVDANGEHIKCDSKALSRDERLCPKGHALMGAEQ